MKRACFLILITGLILIAAGCNGQNTETPVAAEPEPAAEPAAEPMKEPAGEPEPVAAAEPATRIEVAATKDGLTRVGDAKCKMCHKIQHASWANGSHAAHDSILDCESCHGPGSEYMKMTIMKNRELAIAAGLVLPKAGFCTESCHADDWNDGMLVEAHEHKPAS